MRGPVRKTMANPITLLSFFIFSCFSLFPPTICSSNETDLITLLSFKAALNDPQGVLNSWNETIHFCNWNGIRCGRRHPNRVVAINLRSQGLMGPLSPHIGNLSFLRSIILQNNSFCSEIPSEIGGLRRLEVVEFSNNSFTGEIPKNFSQNSNLFNLNLIDNNLSGIIPQELSSLYKLKVLGLSDNELSGPIPPFLGNLTSLRLLSLLSCGLTGEIPKPLVQLRRIKFLSLCLNNLVGTIPSGLFNISTLTKLILAGNQLQGSIPDSIGLTLSNLRSLQLSDNQLGGLIPTSLSNISSLELIDLTSNFFGGPVPRLGKLSHLSVFGIGDNPIKDDINFISSLTNCTNLEDLYMEENPYLFGSLPPSIGNFSRHLTYLVISGTQVHGEVPSSIGNLVGLRRLVLYDNDLEGPIPWDLGKLSSLLELYLGANRFKNKLPSSFGNMTSLNILSLRGNYFSGNLPQSFSNCTNLLDLDLSTNNFNGPIPQEIMSLSSISMSLNLSYNAFIGSIPTEENLFQGEIPSGLKALRGLVELDLSRNNLSGPIPSFLAELRIEKLNLSYNRLQGEVPQEGLFRNRTAFSLDGNKELCGGIPELNLPRCSLMTRRKKNSSSLLKILIPCLISGGAFVTVSVYLILYVYRCGRPRKNVASIASSVGTQFMRLSYGDLIRATDGFSEASVIGSGRFGTVYKGILEDGRTLIAVKVLNHVVKGAVKSFIAECNALRGARHRNLLKILSVCESIDYQGKDFKSLIYEFKANGSLEKWLYHDKEGEQYRSLSMIQRLNIAIDVAQALEYLHCGTDSTIVHGDLKPSNILLDHDMTAYVGDFGLAKIISSMCPIQENSSSIGIRGTIGYVAPERVMRMEVCCTFVDSGEAAKAGRSYNHHLSALREYYRNVKGTVFKL
ncbi:putative LRR receptor-like serine/threonine-protein kinase [Sesamum angolense]|uniref:LRR receptor-like serine/threonine-protein kinase n=1 Tax=Sesamum angolense TaxID=2727404 RepID=A0AAE2BQG4_9LAMI|nr:putative LRR receptor-like serine/threonine-protein kinase [Sesamum angolense]